MSIFCLLQFVAQICWKQTVLGLFVVGENRNCYVRKIIMKKKKNLWYCIGGFVESASGLHFDKRIKESVIKQS
jgi:hypothetical protein